MKRFLSLAITAAFTSLIALSTVAFAETTPTTNNNTNTTPSVNVSTEERAKIESVVQQYLTQKPEVVIEAIQSFQRKQYEQAEKSVKQTQQDAPQYTKALFHQNGDPTAGNPKGTITVVEFFDYQCPHCTSMAPTVAAIVKANPNVRVIYKDWPIRGPVSEFAARAALAAAKQGKYYPMHHALLTAKKQPLTQEAVIQIAKSIGIDIEKLKKDMNDASIDEQLKNTTKLAQDLKLFGTPAFFIGQTDGNNVRYVPGEMNQAQMQEAIDKAK